MINMLNLKKYDAQLLAGIEVKPVSETKYRYSGGILIKGKTKHKLSEIKFQVEFKGKRREIIRNKSLFRKDLDEGIINLGDDMEYKGVFDDMDIGDIVNGFEVVEITGFGFLRNNFTELSLKAGTTKIFNIGTDTAPVMIEAPGGNYTIEGLTDKPISINSSSTIIIDGMTGKIYYKNTGLNAAAAVAFHSFPSLSPGMNEIKCTVGIDISYYVRWL